MLNSAARMRLHLFVGHALALAAIGMSSTACSLLEDEDPPAGVSFQYQAPTCASYTCTPENREILVGSTVTVVASGDQPHRAPQIADASIATIVGQSETCSCATPNGTGSTRLQDIDAACPAEHRKGCSLAVEILTKQPGDAVLEILEGGALLAETTVKVRTARRIDVAVGYGFSVVTPTNGAYEVKVGEPLQVSPRFFGEELQMLATKEGVSFAYDAAVLSPTELSLGTRLAILQVVPHASGESRVDIKAGGTESALQLRVIP